MALRFATVQDAPQLLSIYTPYILNTTITFEYVAPPIAEFEQRIRSVTQKLPYLVYEEDGEIQGYAYASPHMTRAAYQWDVELSIYTDEKHHRKGTGTALYSALIALLKELGYYNLYALVTLPNDRSIGFHRSMGFEEVGVYPHTGYKMGRWCDMAIMALSPQPTLSTPAPAKSIHDLPDERVQEILQAKQRALLLSR